MEIKQRIKSAVSNAMFLYENADDETDIELSIQESLEDDLSGVVSNEVINGLFLRIKNLIIFID